MRLFAVADGDGNADHFQERRFGDFDGDGDLDSDDIDDLFADFFDNLDSEEYDMNVDGNIDQDDVFLWVTVAFGSYMGDANLDGVVNALDLNALGQHWQQTGEWLWSDGNFLLDDIIDAFDLNFVGDNWLQGS